MTTHGTSRVITGPEAAELALISYRQLDHWARKGWIIPSVHSGSGRGQRRLYSIDDVLRLAALRHFAKSGWSVHELGAALADTEVSAAHWLFVGTDSGPAAVATEDELHELLANTERFSVFALDPLRSRLDLDGDAAGAESSDDALTIRRSA